MIWIVNTTKSSILGIIIFFSLTNIYAQSANIDSLVNLLESSGESQNQISLYNELAVEHLILNDDDKFEFYSQKAISTAESTFKKEFILSANKHYLDNLAFTKNPNYTENIISRTESLIIDKGELTKLEYWILFSQTYIKISNIPKANKYALKAISSSIIKEDVISNIKAQEAIGKVLESSNQYVEAYQYYLNALSLSKRLKNNDDKNKHILKCNENLFLFHQYIKNFDEAAKYKLRIIESLSSKTIVDSVKLYWQYYDFAGLSLYSKRYENLSIKLEKILLYSKRNHLLKLEEYTLTLFRTLLIETQDFNKLHNLYTYKFPEQLTKIQTTSPSLYNKILAYGQQSKFQLDSMKYYMDIAESYILKSKSSISKSNFYRRYGELLLINKNYSKSYDKYKLSYDFAMKENYIPYIIESSKMIDSLANMAGNYKEAYIFHNIFHKNLKIRKIQTDQEKLLKIELENKENMLQHEKTEKAKELIKIHNLQYLMITVGIAIIFIILIIMSSVAIPEWVIRSLGFLSVLMFFEFLILILDQKLHHMTHGAPLYIFLVKICILSILLPFHHLVEKRIIKYLIENKQIWRPKKSTITNAVYQLWPWFKKK